MDKAWSILSNVGQLFAALLIAYFTYLLTLNSQKELNNYQKQQLVYSRLMGLKFPIKQIYVSRFESLIYSNYYEARFIKLKQSQDSFDFREANRKMHQSEELVYKIIDIHRDLFSCLGEIQILFKDTEKLDQLIGRLRTMKGFETKSFDPNLSLEKLNEQKVQAVSDLQRLVDKEIGEPIEDLSNYLKQDLRGK